MMREQVVNSRDPREFAENLGWYLWCHDDWFNEIMLFVAFNGYDGVGCA